MNSRLLPAILSLAVLTLTGGGCMRVKTDTVTKPAPTLVIVPGQGVSVAENGTGRGDFGRISLLDTTKITQRFTLRNDNAAPIRIARIEAGCGCTDVSAVSPAGRVLALPATVAPGATIAVRVVLDLAGFGSGDVVKDMAVYGDQSTRPLARMEIGGTLAPLVRFEPEAVRFGKVGRGTAREVTAVVDARLAANGVLPPLEPDGAELRVAPISEARTADRYPADAPAGDHPVIVRRYRVTVDGKAPAGLFARRVYFSPPKPAGKSSDLLTRTNLLVFGEVTDEGR